MFKLYRVKCCCPIQFVRFSLLFFSLRAMRMIRKVGLEFREFEIDKSNNILKFLLLSGHIKSN